MKKYNRGNNSKEFTRNYVAEATTEIFPFWEEECDPSIDEPDKLWLRLGNGSHIRYI